MFGAGTETQLKKTKRNEHVRRATIKAVQDAEKKKEEAICLWLLVMVAPDCMCARQKRERESKMMLHVIL